VETVPDCQLIEITQYPDRLKKRVRRHWQPMGLFHAENQQGVASMKEPISCFGRGIGGERRKIEGGKTNLLSKLVDPEMTSSRRVIN